MVQRAALALIPLLVACAADRDPGELFGPAEEDRLVVDGRLLVGQALPDLFVRRTASPAALYDRAAAAVADAEVEIRSDGVVFAYRADPDSAGRYLPPAGTVEPLTEYILYVRTSRTSVTATTTTPGRFSIPRAYLLDEETLEVVRPLRGFDEIGEGVYAAPENQVIYTEGLLEAAVDNLEVPAYQVAVQSLDLDSDFVLDADFLEEDDYAEFERHGSSPALEARDGAIRLPWFAITFGGRHLVRIYALDDNWFDYLRTGPEEGDSRFVGGLIGDGFERPVFNVEGGIGFFGSAAVDSIGFFVHPLPQPGLAD